ILITTVNAVSQRVMPRAALAKGGLHLQTGRRIELADLQSYLAAHGYHRADTVREAGEFAIRGGIVDLFPAGEENPIRIDLFGDTIESLRRFDAGSQLTTGKIDTFSLVPVTEFSLDEESITRFRQGYREAFGVAQGGDPLYEAV